MTEESTKPTAEPEDAVALLVRAVNQLPSGDRDEVFAWLLRVGSRRTAVGATSWGQGRTGAGILRLFQEAKAGSSQSSGTGAQQMVPVRFPADQHAKLREWCTAHGFSMATVIRGLVAKFLEEQLPDQN